MEKNKFKKLCLCLFRKIESEKNINFRKRFPKTIYEGKIEILEGSEETLEGSKEKFNHYPVSLGHFKRIFLFWPRI
jgi:hypothetical protein